MRSLLSLLLLCLVPCAALADFLRCGDGTIVLRTALSGRMDVQEDGLYHSGSRGNLLQRLLPVLRHKKELIIPGQGDSPWRRESSSLGHWLEEGVVAAAPGEIAGLRCAMKLLPLGKGRILLRLELSNNGPEELELDAGVIFRKGEGLRSGEGQAPGQFLYSKEGAALALTFYSGLKIRPFVPRDWLGGQSLTGLEGCFSRVEIPAGKTVTLWLLMAAGREPVPTGWLGRFPQGRPEEAALFKEALGFWKPWLGDNAFSFREEGLQREYLRSLVRLKSRLLGGLFPDATAPDEELLQAGFAFLENGFYPESAAILKGMTGFYSSPLRYPDSPELQAGYVSLLFSHFVRSGQFQGSLILAGKFLERLARIQVAADGVTASQAAVLAAALMDGSLLMGYARQRLRQEEYSALAGKWLTVLRGFFRTPEGLISLPSPARSLPRTGRFVGALHQGYLGRFLALALQPEPPASVAGGHGSLALAGFETGFHFLGRQHLRRVPLSGQARALASGAINGALSLREAFPDRLLRLLQEELLVLGRISPSIPNCFPYVNARSLLGELLGSVAEREGKLLRLAATLERLRIQARQSEQEFSRRILVQESLTRLEAITSGMLRSHFGLQPVFTTPDVVSFPAAPRQFLDTLRVEPAASEGFVPGVRRVEGRFELSVRPAGGKLATGGGGARFVFKARYRGVDFVFRHAVAVRIKPPLSFILLPPGTEEGFRFSLANGSPLPWDSVQAVLSQGLSLDFPLVRLESGEVRSFLVRPDPALPHGDYPAMITVRIGEHSYATNVVFRHALRIPLTNQRYREGDAGYWKNPEYDDRAWSGTPPAAGIFWMRAGFTLPEAGAGERVVLLLDGIDGRSRIWLNMTELSGSGGVYELPSGVLVSGQKNVLALRLPPGTRLAIPQLYIYKDRKKD